MRPSHALREFQAGSQIKRVGPMIFGATVASACPGGRTARSQPVTVALSGALYPSSTAAMHHDNHVLGRQW